MELKVDKPLRLTHQDVLATRTLYYRYGSWLLGYLVEVVKDYELAENYLVEIFKEVPYRLEDFTQADSNAWLRLKLMAKSKLSSFARSRYLDNEQNDVGAMERIRLDRYVNTMNTEQQMVFCGVYYYQQSTATLAAELNKSEQEVRKILREAFILIRHG